MSAQASGRDPWQRWQLLSKSVKFVRRYGVDGETKPSQMWRLKKDEGAKKAWIREFQVGPSYNCLAQNSAAQKTIIGGLVLMFTLSSY